MYLTILAIFCFYAQPLLRIVFGVVGLRCMTNCAYARTRNANRAKAQNYILVLCITVFIACRGALFNKFSSGTVENSYATAYVMDT